MAANDADTDEFPERESVQTEFDPEAEHTPPHPEKLEPAEGVAVRVTVSPELVVE